MKQQKYYLYAPLALIIAALFILTGCGEAPFNGPTQIKKEEIIVKWYTCEKCGVRTTLNDPEHTAVSTEHNGKNFKTVITSVKMGEYAPIIETKRLRIRAIRPDDLDDFYNWGKKPEVSQSTMWKPHASREKSEQLINEWIGKYKRGIIAPWAIEYKKNGRMIGSGGIVTYYPASYRVVVGWSFDSEYWGQGLGTEMARAMVEYGTMMLKMNRVEAIARTDNVASRRVLEKAGMTHEGLFREYMSAKKQVLNIYQYGLIKSDIAEQLKTSVCRQEAKNQ